MALKPTDNILLLISSNWETTIVQLKTESPKRLETLAGVKLVLLKHIGAVVTFSSDSERQLLPHYIGLVLPPSEAATLVAFLGEFAPQLTALRVGPEILWPVQPGPFDPGRSPCEVLSRALQRQSERFAREAQNDLGFAERRFAEDKRIYETRCADSANLAQLATSALTLRETLEKLRARTNSGEPA